MGMQQRVRSSRCHRDNEILIFTIHRLLPRKPAVVSLSPGDWSELMATMKEAKEGKSISSSLQAQ